MRNPIPRRKPGQISQGYTLAEALDEADRCLVCENARCEAACPLHNQIPRWISALKQGRADEAYRIIRETSPMPEICSRLCPQERLCEGACGLGIKYESIAIGQLERFVADVGLKNFKTKEQPIVQPQQRKRLAAVGSGPASLAFAQNLQLQGHPVTVIERWSRLGGVLSWIPHFKLPAEVLDRHLESLRELGVRFQTGVEVRSAGELLKNYDAVFLGVGASRPSSPKIPGIKLGGVLSSTEFLVGVYYDPSSTLPNQWQPLTSLKGQRVGVFGGGDSAMDCVRTAIRLGASEALCFYRRDEANMPGSKKEVRTAKAEGVKFQLLAAPRAFHSRDSRTVSQIECIRMELGAPDSSGRRSPVPVKNSTFMTDVDLVVLAFGYEVEDAFEEKSDLLTPKNLIKTNPVTGATPIPGVFAGGDCVTGPSLVCAAAYAGVVAAQNALRYFNGEPWENLASLEYAD